jgi:hypothetical protein
MGRIHWTTPWLSVGTALVAVFLLALLSLTACDETNVDDWASGGSLSVVDTGQTACFDDRDEIACPGADLEFGGQDAQYAGAQPAYVDNGDGTVTDTNTGLIWQQSPGEKMSFDDAVAGADSFSLAGYDDWRLPTIKELYSLILFSGLDPSGCESAASCELVPFIDDSAFDFEYGDEDGGERLIDAQWASSTEYVHTTMNGDHTMFGVNFADGRIKGYGTADPMSGGDKLFFVAYVRGGTGYGVNDLTDNRDGTVTDVATDLIWTQQDSGHLGAGDLGGLDWQDALAWCEALELAQNDDWRLPSAKELQTLVDYTRSPATTGSPAIDPIFETSSIIDEGGAPNFPFFWTSTTHANTVAGDAAAYVAFGEALGWMQGPSGDYELMDVHGAGAQRSDPKAGDPSDYPYGHGPQGDVIRIFNHARCVRDLGLEDDESRGVTAA